MKIAMGIEYNGRNFCGWQKQKSKVRTAQGALDKSISFVANEDITTFCAGRTDAGVHASSQVIHFETNAERSIRSWHLGVNTNLDSDISVTWVKFVDDDFHARFSAKNRRYCYVIAKSNTPPAILNGLVTKGRVGLDIIEMSKAANILLGEQDFSSFRAANCQSKTAFRFIEHIRVLDEGNYIIIDIQANSFLYHMVRNIVGALLKIGEGKEDIDWFKELLGLKNRCLAPATAPADGLYLVGVGYNEKYKIPKGIDNFMFAKLD